MKLMIDIPKELYEDIQRRSTAIQADGDTLENAVLNGTVIDDTSDDTPEEITKPFWKRQSRKSKILVLIVVIATCI